MAKKLLKESDKREKQERGMQERETGMIDTLAALWTIIKKEKQKGLHLVNIVEGSTIRTLKKTEEMITTKTIETEIVIETDLKTKARRKISLKKKAK